MRIPILILSGLVVAGGLFGQAFKMPRMADGHPNLQGTYDLATMTPVERRRGAPATMSKEDARKLEVAAQKQRAEGDKAISGDRGAPPKGGDGSGGAAGNVGGYNGGWLDPGNSFTVVDGQVRTSLVVDPPDGRVPAYTAEAQKRLMGMRSRPTSDETESKDPGLEKAPGSYDDPERRPLGERCLLGFGSTAGPPALPDYFYNNLHQIVQTKDQIMILTEMVHDVRIVRMNSQHVPNTIRKWLGDSIGHWEGDTLVVETTNLNDQTRFRGATENMKVTERFSRVGPKELNYKFTVEDPATWAKPWTGEYTWPATDSHIYEYACHEANYAMGGILSGARLREKEEAAAKAAK